MADQKMQIVISALDETQRAFANLKTALNQVQGELKGVGSQAATTNSKMSSLVSSFGKFQTAIAAAATGAVVQQLYAAGAAAERLKNSFEIATGSAGAGAAAMEFVRAEAQRLGLDLQSTAQSFLKLSASAKGTGLEGDKIKQVFTAVAGAGNALGLSAGEVDGALLAVSQMMSKGTVSAEELRGQLGERLPGAFQVAARAMGVNTAELGKMLEQGKILSDDFLPKFAAELQKTFVPSEKSLSSLTAETTRLKTAWFDLRATIMDSGGSSVFSGALEVITALVNGTKEFVANIRLGFGLLADGRFADFFNGTDVAPGPVLDPKEKALLNAMKGKASTPAGKPNTTNRTSPKDNFTVDGPGFMGWKREADMIKQESAYIAQLSKEQDAARRAAEAADQAEKSAYQKEAEAWHKAELDDTRERLLYAEKAKQYAYDASAQGGLLNGLTEFATYASEIGHEINYSVTRAFQGMTDALTSFVTTGKANFSDLANSIISDMVRISIQKSITGPLASAAGSFFSGLFAEKGMAIQGGVQKFASGGLVLRPTFFGMQNGMGLMGEAGPEAIMPLTRTASGHLGVRTDGGSNQAMNVQVNVINQTSQQVSAKTGNVQFDGRRFVIDTILQDVASGGSLRGLMAGRAY